MAFAISIRSDNDSAEAIRSLWATCSALEASPSMEALCYPPHITLAVYEQIGAPQLVEAFDSCFAHTLRFTAKFESLGYFETPHTIVLWAAPILPEFVHSIHKQVHALVGADLSHPNYRPESWVPHCSLATSIEICKKSDVLDFINRPLEPFEVVFDVADCASFLPVEVLHERKLPADSQ
jgi:2'-5' RNA ligase